MFGLRKKAQPKDSYEQPECAAEDVPERDAEPLPISEFTGEPYDPAWGQQIRRLKANPSIISTVWK